MLTPVVLPIELTPSQVRPIVYRILTKKHGLNIKSSGLSVLTEFLGRYFGVEWRGSKSEKTLDDVAKLWKAQDRGLFIEEDALVEVLRVIVQESGNEDADISEAARATAVNPQNNLLDPRRRQNGILNWQDFVQVLSAQEQPRFTYDHVNKRFDVFKGKGRLETGRLLGSAKDLVEIFLNRYYVLRDRLMRNEEFQVPEFRPTSSVTRTTNQNDKKISMIRNMLGRDKEWFLLFGLMTFGPDGKLYVEDPSGKVQLDLSQAATSDEAYFCPGMFVLCQGVYQNEIFYLHTVVQPPGESRKQTKQFYGNMDMMGIYTKRPISSSGSSMYNNNVRGDVGTADGRRVVEKVDKQFERQLLQKEKELIGHRMIILGCDIFLDDIHTMDALRKLFRYIDGQVQNGEAEAPVAVVFPGSFVSSAFTASGSSARYKELFDQLAQLVGEYFGPNSEMAGTKLVFVPGQNDPWMATFSGGATGTWPLEPISKLFTTRLGRASRNVILTSNPTRIAYLSQEIVIARDDYGARFRRTEIALRNVRKEYIRKMERETETMDQNYQKNDNQNDNTADTDEDDVDENKTSERQAIKRLISENTMKRHHARHYAGVSPDIAEARKVIKTILCQGHMAPAVLSTQPVIWARDYSLHLAMLPHMFVLCDGSTPQFTLSYNGCHTINAGQLIQRNKINWMEYIPSRGSSEIKFLHF